MDNLRKVISFSLYGNVNKYFSGLIENCKIINSIYPDFWIYVYLGNDFDRSIINTTLDEFKNILLIETGVGGHEVMSYRFFSIDRPEVGIAFSRDLDSRINLRDQYCINQFIKSDKKFQIIRDNVMHGTEILGGMWGIKKELLQTTIRSLFDNFKKPHIIFKKRKFEHGTDQLFLSQALYKKVVNDSIVFDEYFHYNGETPQKIDAPVIYFPETNGFDFVGRPANVGEKFEIRS